MDLAEHIGREVSLPVPGSRKRRRGYVAEVTDDGKLLVTFYPSREDWPRHEQIACEPSQLRLLKADVPANWRAIDVLHEDGRPYLSLRFRPDVIKILRSYAKERNLTFEQGFNMILREQLERRTRQMKAAAA